MVVVLQYILHMSKREGTFIVDKQMCNQIINFQVAMIQCKGLIIFNEYVLEKNIYLLIHDRRRYQNAQLDEFFKFVNCYNSSCNVAKP